MIRHSLLGLVAALTLAAGASAASAADYHEYGDAGDDVVVSTNYERTVERRVIEPDYDVVEDRPPDCGRFYYWDGDDCVDARVVPPYGDD